MSDQLNQLLAGLNQRSSAAELAGAQDLLCEAGREAEAHWLTLRGYWVVRRLGPAPRVDPLKEGWREWRGTRISRLGGHGPTDPYVEWRWWDGQWRPLEMMMAVQVRSISPSGFEWGYLGQGPLALALALLVDGLNMDCAQSNYHQLAAGVISTWAREGWSLHTLDLYTWLDLQPRMGPEDLIDWLSTGRRRTGGGQGEGTP